MELAVEVGNQLFLTGSMMRKAKIVSMLAVAISSTIGNFSVASDRCLTVDAGSENHDVHPKFEICIPKNSAYSRPKKSSNSVQFTVGYPGSWLPAGVYRVSADRMPGMAAQAHDFEILLGMKEVSSTQGQIHYRLDDELVLKKIPKGAQEKYIGITAVQALSSGDLVWVESAIVRPSGYEVDSRTIEQRIVSEGLSLLFSRVTVASTRAKHR